MENQSVAAKLEALVKLQAIDSKLDELKKLRGDLPDEVQDLEDEMEGYRTRLTRFEAEQKEVEDLIKKNKEGIKEAEKLVKKYGEQQKNVKNNREFDAITKEVELQELEIQICEKRIKEAKEKIELKKEEITKIETLIKERNEDLDAKKGELNGILGESQEERETPPLVKRKSPERNRRETFEVLRASARQPFEWFGRCESRKGCCRRL